MWSLSVVITSVWSLQLPQKIQQAILPVELDRAQAEPLPTKLALCQTIYKLDKILDKGRKPAYVIYCMSYISIALWNNWDTNVCTILAQIVTVSKQHVYACLEQNVYSRYLKANPRWLCCQVLLEDSGNYLLCDSKYLWRWVCCKVHSTIPYHFLGRSLR